MRRYRLGPLGVRLALAFVGVALVAIAVFAALVLVVTRAGVANLVESQRGEDTQNVNAAVVAAYEAAGGWPRADLRAAFSVAAAAGGELTVYDAGGSAVASQPESMTEQMGQMHGTGQGSTTTTMGSPRSSDIVVGDSIVGVAQIRFPTNAEPQVFQQVRDDVIRLVLIGAGLAAVVALIVAVLVTRRLTRPVIALTDAVRRLEAGDHDSRVADIGAPGELAELASAFDDMAAAVQRQEQLRRSLVADVAHELRTPATILQGTCEAFVDGVLEPTPDRLSSMHEEVLRLGRVIEDLESLASAEAAGLHLHRAPVELGALATGAVEILRGRFADAGVAVAVEATPVWINGDAQRLHQVIVNLLTNALKATPSGGHVTVTVDAPSDSARLVVADTGGGIPSDELPHLFERFWRGRNAEDATGSGIGLAIVDELVTAHHGQVKAQSTLGQGAVFTVLLPLAPPAALGTSASSSERD
jgi:two-component system sensor histidine kinase BaeS